MWIASGFPNSQRNTGIMSELAILPLDPCRFMTLLVRVASTDAYRRTPRALVTCPPYAHGLQRVRETVYKPALCPAPFGAIF